MQKHEIIAKIIYVFIELVDIFSKIADFHSITNNIIRKRYVSYTYISRELVWSSESERSANVGFIIKKE